MNNTISEKTPWLHCSHGVLASPARFERATFRLGGGCSIQLSYGDISYPAILSNFPLPVKRSSENVYTDIEISPLQNYRFRL